MGEFEMCMSFLNRHGMTKKSELYLEKMRSIEIETQWGLLWDFLDTFEEMYPDEFEKVFEQFNAK